jgi:glycerol-3-phosphate cytidylyltransferase
MRILGVEYEGKEFTGREICHKRNIDLFFNGRDHSFSSSELRQRVANAEDLKQKMTKEGYFDQVPDDTGGPSNK